MNQLNLNNEFIVIQRIYCTDYKKRYFINNNKISNYKTNNIIKNIKKININIFGVILYYWIIILLY